MMICFYCCFWLTIGLVAPADKPNVFLPGRVTNCRRCTYLVLDEADRMFDMGFEPQVEQQKHKKQSSKETIFAGGLRILHYRKKPAKIQDLTIFEPMLSDTCWTLLSTELQSLILRARQILGSSSFSRIGI